MRRRTLVLATAAVACVLLGCGDDETAPTPTTTTGVAGAGGGGGVGGGAAGHGGSGGAPEPATRFTEAERRAAVDAASAELEAAGYEVREGALVIFRIEHCEQLDSCYGNNPTSPYGLYALPQVPGEVIPEQPMPVPGHPELHSPWRQRADEAVVFFGRTPPPARYFSYRTYLFGRVDIGSGNTDELFASLGDALNPANIAVGSDGSYEDAFDQDAIVISTADRTVDAAVRDAFASAGVSRDVMNVDSMPRELLLMGHEASADSFAMLNRMALFDDAGVGEAYLNAPLAIVLRVTPATPAVVDPYSAVPHQARGTGQTEAHLEAAVDDLEAAIRATHPGAVLTTSSSTLADLDGYQCIADHTNCLGDISDTVYARNLPARLLHDDPDEFFVVFGVNHEATGKARYSSAAVYYLQKLAGVASFNSPDMVGSADVYLPTHPDRDLLYAFKAKRDCTGEPYCLEVPVDFPGVPLNGFPAFVFRAYMEPGKTVGPLGSELLFSRVIKVNP